MSKTPVVRSPSPYAVWDPYLRNGEDFVGLVEWRDETRSVARAVETRLVSAVEKVLAGELGDLADRCEVGLTCVSSARMRELNAMWRSEDRPTDVLSFPTDPPPTDPDTPPVVLGDIVLAPEHVEPWGDAGHVGGMVLCVVHAALHLLGHDHDDPARQRAMFALQERYAMEALGGVSEREKKESGGRIRAVARAFDFATRGVVEVFRTERHMRFHFWVALAVTAWAIAMRLPTVELLFVWSAILLVVFSEMFNTALEDIVDLITTERDERARRVKDIAAGIVLTTVVYAGGVFVIVFLRRLNEMWFLVKGVWAAALGRDSAAALLAQSMLTREMSTVELGASGLVMLALLIIIFKDRLRKGTFASGGWVSGHATVAFYVAALLSLATMDPWVFGGATVLAVLVVQSRVEGGIHTWSETLRGALLGGGLAALLFLCGTATVQATT